MSHAIHPDSHTHGLADDCQDCAEHAERPFAGLDSVVLRDLIDRTLRSRFGGDDPFGPVCGARSDAEARAMANVMNTFERMGAAFTVAPDLVTLYLGARWHVAVEVSGRDGA